MQEPPPLAPQHLAPMAFTIEEAIQVSRVGRNYLYLAIQTGALPARKLGRKNLILRDDLHAWLKNLPPASSGDASTAKTRAPAEMVTAPVSPRGAPSRRHLVEAE